MDQFSCTQEVEEAEMKVYYHGYGEGQEDFSVSQPQVAEGPSQFHHVSVQNHR